MADLTGRQLDCKVSPQAHGSAHGRSHHLNRRHVYITQWGMDPIWQTGGLGGILNGIPEVSDFPDRMSEEYAVTLAERPAPGAPSRINVAGFAVAFDAERKLWYADRTIEVPTQTYMPVVRLALVRYQPHALNDAKVSNVVLADFAQLLTSPCGLVPLPSRRLPARAATGCSSRNTNTSRPTSCRLPAVPSHGRGGSCTPKCSSSTVLW